MGVGRKHGMNECEVLPGELWKRIEGFDPCYEVSNLGRLRKVIVLSTYANEAGYPMAFIYAGCRRISTPVHTLVARAFIGPRPLKFVVNHKNGNKQDSRDTNLEYVTKGDDVRHAIRSGLRRKGNIVKLTQEKADAIRQEHLAGPLSQRKLAKKYGVSPVCIWHIIWGKTWNPTLTKGAL